MPDERPGPGEIQDSSGSREWDERYRSGALPWDTGTPSSELVRVVQEYAIKPCRALEMGCGTGTNARYLASMGFDVTAVDLSQTAIDIARSKQSPDEPGVDFRVADLAADADLGEPYDFLFDRGVYHVVRGVNLDAFLATLSRASKPGALYLSIAGNSREKHDPGPPTVSDEEIRSEVGRVFKIVHLREIRFDGSPARPTRPLGWSCLMRRR